ncbi:DUF2946 family protein [Pseudomonas otitidis]|uniref:DUF2946 family protein n=1 Tax=Metapseudomonas otitidis TaxID=319939 RepID=UPI001F3DEA1E|nr:DUF2946 family protein [Pseudomonas otitidis]MDI6527604.1 DUF2946 family protein [Pseudomonas otitidis]
MKLARRHRSLIAWMLYFSVLFSSLACALGHGQMAGLALSGLDGQFCSLDASGGGKTLGESAAIGGNLVSGSGCALSSTFGALLLAAFFGLLTLLAPSRQWRRPASPARLASLRDWRPANPRASPLFA